MKRLLFAFFIMLMLPLSTESGVLNEASIRVVIHRPATSGINHLSVPAAYYYPVSSVLTLQFPAEDFVPYTLSVSSAYATLDYYVTTPFLSVPIYDTNVIIDLQLETDGGDIFYGSFEATSGTLSQ